MVLLRQGRRPPHREARQKRRELRLRQQAEQEELELRMRELQVANEAKQVELEKMRTVRTPAGGWVGVWRGSIGDSSVGGASFLLQPISSRVELMPSVRAQSDAFVPKWPPVVIHKKSYAIKQQYIFFC